MIKFIAFFGTLLFSLSASAANYKIDYDKSQLKFSGIHAGTPFEGQFNEWQAEIIFDPDDLENSTISAKFNPSTAKTGNPLYDGTLPQADWFDVSNFAQASFQSSAFKVNTDGSFKVEGLLTIRGIEKPKIFNFTLSDLSSSPVEVKSSFQIDRLAYEIGKKSDPKAEWVSQYIDMTLHLFATR